MRKVEMRKIRLYSVMMVALVASLVAASIARAELVIDITQVVFLFPSIFCLRHAGPYRLRKISPASGRILTPM